MVNVPGGKCSLGMLMPDDTLRARPPRNASRPSVPVRAELPLMAHQDDDQTRGRERVFISYARKDGEEFAARLCERLEAAGVGPVWRDRDRMYGGHNWWLQITSALERVEFLVLVITEAAVESRVVHREWRRGRQEGGWGVG